MNKIVYKSIVGLFAGSMLLISSCSKNDGVHGGDPSGSVTVSKSAESRIKDVIARLPHVKATNSNSMRQGGGNTTQSTGWDFSDPNSGNSTFTTNGGVTYTSSSNSFTLNSGGGGGNGGTVVAGASSLDINYTFCFASGDQVNGLDVFNTGAPNTGVSAVIGVSGDFSKLGSNSTGDDLAEAFHGMAFYVVYDGTASGSYKVVNWLEDSKELNDIDALDNKAFAFVMDFKNGRLFLSTGGTVKVNGGDMGFNGTYIEVSGFLNDDGEFDLNGELKFKKVPGFGAMGCN